MSALVLPSRFIKPISSHAQMSGFARSSNDSTATDEQLMLRYRNGDASAFERLYKRHSDSLHRFALRMLLESAEAEEVFQEIWIAVIRGKDRYEPSAKFTTYLFAIAHRRALHRLSKRFHGREMDLDSFESSESELVDEKEPNPMQIAYRIGAGKALLDAVAQLPPMQREAFLLHAEEEMSVEQIAEVAGVGRETAKSRLRYAHARLRKALEAWR